MTRRMLTALVALGGVFVATYLAFYKAGLIGSLACGTGSCETVQQSPWAKLLGLPVAVWGVGYYLAVFALAFTGTLGRWADDRRIALALLLLTTWGVIFSVWLTYLELFVIRAICRYCVVSAILAFILFVLSMLDWRAGRKMAPGRASPASAPE
jgi:uncharacterized membrane protein